MGSRWNAVQATRHAHLQQPLAAKPSHLVRDGTAEHGPIRKRGRHLAAGDCNGSGRDRLGACPRSRMGIHQRFRCRLTAGHASMSRCPAALLTIGLWIAAGGMGTGQTTAGGPALASQSASGGDVVRLPPVGEVAAADGAAAVDPARAAPPLVPVADGELDRIEGELKKLAWKKGDFTVTPYAWLTASGVYETTPSPQWGVHGLRFARTGQRRRRLVFRRQVDPAGPDRRRAGRMPVARRQAGRWHRVRLPGPTRAAQPARRALPPRLHRGETRRLPPFDRPGLGGDFTPLPRHAHVRARLGRRQSGLPQGDGAGRARTLPCATI